MHLRPVLPLDGILLPGDHNVENYMAAIAALDGLVPDEVIRAFAARFAGVEHRIELVRTVDGVRYYNDSIASSPTRTIAGLRSFHQKVILIAGGYDKHIPFDQLGPEVVEHVKLLVLTGATAPKIRAAVDSAPGYQPGKPEILEEEDFTQAVLTARSGLSRGTWYFSRLPAPPLTSSRTLWSGARPLRRLSTSYKDVTWFGNEDRAGAALRPVRPLRL